MTRNAEAAARNNAAWCDVVCRTHALDTRFDDDAWTSRTRTPIHYPDAVTLVRDPPVRELLDRIDVSAGCSIKDSFASLDLTTCGFRVLFEAEWIVRTPGAARPTSTRLRWEVVRDSGEFVVWEQAWRGDHGPAGVLLVDLLGHDWIAVLAGYADHDLVAGAVLNRTREVVGISNFFAAPGVASASWNGCVAFGSALFPDSTLVGYQSGGASERPPGWDSAGPLRVWLHEGELDGTPQGRDSST